MSSSKRVKLNLICSLGSQFIVIILGLIVPRITMVKYGSEINGLLNSATQFVVYLTLFESGIQAVAVQSLYKLVKTDDKSEINKILSAVNITYRKTGLVYITCLVIMSAVYPFIANSSESYITVFLVALFSGLGNVLLFFVQGKYKVLLQAEGKNYILTNIQTTITVLNNAVKIVLLLHGYNVALVIGVTFLVSMLQAIYISIYINRKYKWIDLSVEPKMVALEQKNSALAHQISGLIFQNTDVLILTIFCDLKVVSVYSVYKMIVGHISSLLNIPFTSFNFALGQQFNTDQKRYTRTIDTVEVYYSSLVFTIYTVTLCLLQPFVNLYTIGVKDMNYSDSLLVILFVAVELLSIIRVPMMNTINYAGHFRKTLVRTIIESAINLGISLLLVPVLGIYGVLIGTVVALIYRTIDIIVYSNIHILERKPWKTIKIYAVNIAFLPIIYILYKHLRIEITSYLSFVLVGTILAIICSAVYFGVNSILNKSERNSLNGFLKSYFRKQLGGD